MNNEYTQLIHELLHKYRNKSEALKMKRYMRDQYAFFGMRAPQRKEIVKTLIKKHGLPSEESFNTIIYRALTGSKTPTD